MAFVLAGVVMQPQFPLRPFSLGFLAFVFAISPEILSQVTGRLYLGKDSYIVGEPLMFSIEIKNATGESIQLYPNLPGQPQGNFSFSMRRTDKPGSSCEAVWNLPAGGADPSEVKAGDTYTYEWPLDFWYRVQNPGTYQTAIAGNLLFTSLRGGVQRVQFSADLQLNVVPGEPAHVKEVLSRFEADLRSPNYEVQHHALDVMATTAPAYFHDEIFRLARDEDPFIAEHGVGALQRMNTPESRALLAEIVATRKADTPDDLELRCGAIKALGESGDSNYLQTLTPYMEHVNSCESKFAMIAIAQLGKQNAVPQLQGLLQSAEVKTRLNAVAALRLTAAPGAVDALIGALRDKDEGVRTAAASNLTMLTAYSVISPDQPNPTPLQLENLWLVWWGKHRKDTKLSETRPEVCRVE